MSLSNSKQEASIEAMRARVEARKQQRPGQSPKIWDPPITLEDGPLPQMKPVSGILGRFSEGVSRATETPLELPLSMALATAATACQKKFLVQVKPGYSEPLNLYFNTALDPGNRKSSVHAEVTKPLLQWESQQRAELEPIVKDLASQKANQETRIKSLRAKYGKAKQAELEGLEMEIRELERDLVAPPVLPKLWVQDVTPEKLGCLMAEHGEKMAVLAAEGGVFDIVAGRYTNGVANLDLFLQAHSGDPVRVDRGSRDSIYMEAPALTMGLSTQPELLKRLSEMPGFRGRGFLARFLYLLPKSTLGQRALETEPVSESLRVEYSRVIHSLLNIKPAKDPTGQPAPYILNLSKRAYSEWLDFARVVEKDLREGGRFEHITDWAGKLPGAAIRLAGLLHCIEHHREPWAGEINLQTMKQALELAAIFSVHALKVFDLMGADKSLEGARKVWRWVERGRRPLFTKRDCHNALQGSFPRVVELEACLSVLEERHLVHQEIFKTGGRPSVTYRVNPIILEGWQ